MEFNLDETQLCEKPTRKRALVYFKEYCDYSGIHGFRYIAEDRTMCERVWWIISLLLSVVFSGLMIYQIIEKYVNCPVIVTFSTREVRITQIPFPAVTICPISKVSQEFFNLTDAAIKKNDNANFSGETEKLYNIASTICDLDRTNNSNNGTTSDDIYNFMQMGSKFTEQFDTQWDSAKILEREGHMSKRKLKEIAFILLNGSKSVLNCSVNLDSCWLQLYQEESQTNILYFCVYAGRNFNCSDYFKPILTEEGVCYSFNILDRMDMFRENVFRFGNYHKVDINQNWDIEEGYKNTEEINYPLRAFQLGAKNGLSLVLQTKDSDIEYECSLEEKGFWATLHLPSTSPTITDSYFTIPLNHVVTGQIIPRIIKTADDIKLFDPIKRDCYFQTEKSLKFFKIYTQHNCLLECITDFVLQECGCVGFYMPRHNDTRVCILNDKICMKNAEVKFTKLHINEKTVGNCDCLPSCTELTYDWEISQNKLEHRPREKKLRLRDGYVYSTVYLYFQRNHIETRERTKLYEFSDFISNFGGLLGLFTGFSMLSLIEIIYFLSLRIWGNIKMYRNWSGKNKYDITNPA